MHHAKYKSDKPQSFQEVSAIVLFLQHENKPYKWWPITFLTNNFPLFLKSRELGWIRHFLLILNRAINACLNYIILSLSNLLRHYEIMVSSTKICAKSLFTKSEEIIGQVKNRTHNISQLRKSTKPCGMCGIGFPPL